MSSVESNYISDNSQHLPEVYPSIHILVVVLSRLSNPYKDVTEG